MCLPTKYLRYRLHLCVHTPAMDPANRIVHQLQLLNLDWCYGQHTSGGSRRLSAAAAHISLKRLQSIYDLFPPLHMFLDRFSHGHNSRAHQASEEKVECQICLPVCQKRHASVTEAVLCHSSH